MPRDLGLDLDLLKVLAEHHLLVLERDRPQVDLVALLGTQAIDDEGRALLDAVLLTACLDHCVAGLHLLRFFLIRRRCLWPPLILVSYCLRGNAACRLWSRDASARWRTRILASPRRRHWWMAAPRCRRCLAERRWPPSARRSRSAPSAAPRRGGPRRSRSRCRSRPARPRRRRCTCAAPR